MLDARWSLAVLVVAGLILSGCAAEGEGAANAAAGGSDEPVDVVPSHDSSTGAIEGQVLNIEQLPIDNAELDLEENGNYTTRTAPDGRFAIDLVPPGIYTLRVNALGFYPKQEMVTVNAGAVSDPVMFELDALPSNGPYKETLIYPVTMTAVMYKLTPDCIYTDVNPLVKTCGGVRVTCSPNVCETHTNGNAKFTPEWKTIVGEVMWEQQSGVTGRGFNFDLNAPNITRGASGSINQAEKHTWVSATDQSPIHIRIDKPTTLIEREIAESDWNNYPNDDCTAPDEGAANCDWFFRLFAAACDLGICPSGFGPDYGIMYNGVAEIYFTYFIKEGAHPDWTALPES